MSERLIQKVKSPTDSFDFWDVTITTPQRGVGKVRAALVSDGQSFKVEGGA